LINDGLDPGCGTTGAVWSYNQGVVLAGLAELYQQDQDPGETGTARTIALAAIEHLTYRGILHDPCEPSCGGDGPQFKGIFLRNLMALNDSFPDDRYVSFAVANAQSIWEQDQGAAYRFGLIWSGPFDSGDAARQTSALDALIAAGAMTAPRLISLAGSVSLDARSGRQRP
jgi:predicted alpha-1,6-mannanase (GH76 family)